jgi:Ca-activated chloride channel family protein
MKKFFLYILIPINAHAFFEYDRAIVQGYKGNWQESKELLKKALPSDPQNPTLAYDLGVSCYKTKEYDKALSYFQSAAQSPDGLSTLTEQAWFNAGNAYVQLKQLQEAINAYDKTLGINPSNIHAQHNRDIVKKMLEEQKKQEEKNKDKKDEQKETENKDSEQKKDKKNKSDQSKEKQEKNNESNTSDKSSENKKDNQHAQNKNPEQQDQQKQDTPDSQKGAHKKEADHGANIDKQSSKNVNPLANQSDAKESADKKLSPGIARMLENQEKKDAALNKQMMKAMAAQQGGSYHDENYW